MTINALNSGRRGAGWPTTRTRNSPTLENVDRGAGSTCATPSPGTIAFTSSDGQATTRSRRERRRDRRPPARPAPAREAPRSSTARRRRRRARRLRPLSPSTTRRRCIDARPRGRTSTCRSSRTTSRRGCGTTCSALAEARARPAARHDPGDGADRDAAGGVRDGGDPLRAARALARASTPAAGTTSSASIKTVRRRPGSSCCPTARRGDDDGAVHARLHAMLLVRTCHKRGAHAIGGMAAFIPSRRDPEAERRARDRGRRRQDARGRATASTAPGSRTRTSVADRARGVRRGARRPAQPDRPARATTCTVDRRRRCSTSPSTPGAVTEAGPARRRQRRLPLPRVVAARRRRRRHRRPDGGRRDRRDRRVRRCGSGSATAASRASR